MTRIELCELLVAKAEGKETGNNSKEKVEMAMLYLVFLGNKKQNTVNSIKCLNITISTSLISYTQEHMMGEVKF